MVADTLGGRPPGRRLRLGIARAGLCEWARRASLRAWVRAHPRLGRRVSQSLLFLVIGSVYFGAVQDLLTAPFAARDLQRRAAAGVFAAVVAITLIAVVAYGLALLPALIRFWRAGQRARIWRQAAWAAAATTGAAGGVVWLALIAHPVTYQQLSESVIFAVVPLISALLLVAAFASWRRLAKAIGPRLTLKPGEGARQILFGEIVSAGVLLLAPAEVILWATTRPSWFWLGIGVSLLAALGRVLPASVRQAWRRGQRIRADAAPKASA